MARMYTPNLRSTSGKSVVWLTLLLAMAAWVILLISLSVLQHDCASNEANVQVVFQLAPNACSKYFRYQWWIIFFEIFNLFAIFAATAMGVVYLHRVALCTLLGMVTVLLMDMTNTFLITKDNTSGSLHSKLTAFFVGSLLCAICNGLLILVLGSHDEVATTDTVHGYGGAHHHAGVTTDKHTVAGI